MECLRHTILRFQTTEHFINMLFFFGSAGVWTSGFALAKQALYYLTTPPVLFALVILELGSRFLLRPSWTVILLFYASWHSWDDRLLPLYPVIGWDGISWALCLGWPQTTILLISVSQIPRITCVNHQCPAYKYPFSKVPLTRLIKAIAELIKSHPRKLYLISCRYSVLNYSGISHLHINFRIFIAELISHNQKAKYGLTIYFIWPVQCLKVLSLNTFPSLALL
jgi:hypothetical protein